MYSTSAVARHAARWCTAEAAISWSRGSRLLLPHAEPGVAWSRFAEFDLRAARHGKDSPAVELGNM
ncbi:MAG TPA: hypothetical protein VK784_05275 [Pseudonocardiaceae bacterium]|nr:hypothetical protein [Pseudonocardiaceae bacterium]